LPVGLIAWYDNELCGIAALKAHSLSPHTHLSPWAAAGFVLPPFRGRGIGSSLVRALTEVARGFSYSNMYGATATAMGLLERQGWPLMERHRYDGKAVSVDHKAFSQHVAPDG
jgi:GNAT superfamily N-acetyltransferase